MTSPKHKYEILIKAPPDRVWEAITDPSYTSRYFFHTAFESSLEPGSAMRYVMPNGDTADPFENAVVRKAREMLIDTIDPLSGGGFQTMDGLRSTSARGLNTLSLTLERHENFTVYAEGVIHDIEHIDQTEVIVKLTSDQQVLEASYASLARLQSITLLDFL